MIDRNELKELVSEFGLDVNVIEKDYVLGWLLAGISQHAYSGRHEHSFRSASEQ